MAAKESHEPKSTEKRGVQMLFPELFTHGSVLLITKRGPSEIVSVSAVDVGWKALGLSELPLEWTPPFFVVSAECFKRQNSYGKLNSWVPRCVTRTAFAKFDSLIIRSSGTVERMHDRGSLLSKRCKPFEIISTIKELRAEIPESSRPHVHWIVQKAIRSQRRGHLSNERRVSRDPRDWIIEFEASVNSPGHAVRIGIRPWREGAEVSLMDLECRSETEISLRLRQVAKWGLQSDSRIHFEWVWDGRKLWIVQADTEESTGGTNPTLVLKTSIPKVDIGALRCFHVAESIDYERYDKLRNAALYKTLNYKMPSFFVFDDPAAISKILEGDIFDDIEKDLDSLINRPLIIRTDGATIPAEKWEMLPRSDPLTSTKEASDWLLNRFRVEIQKADLEAERLCLIAHHFIPSVASAWARAEPETRFVRIEALWGIPEGLYWYSHDTFEVDTQEVRLPSVGSPNIIRFRVCGRRLRYKRTFVANGENGKWTPAVVCAPFDWRPSITKQEWLFEIALSTRRIADLEGYPVAVMWFVNNHPATTQHRVLPWYHIKSELVGPARAAPSRKFTSSDDFRIATKADWKMLQQRIRSGDRLERVVVEPEDAALIRNRTFAKELGKLGARKKFVIELAGGILSHAYYIFTKEGAQVECIDLVGVEEELADYNKIVRDRIPEIISKRGERTESVRLKGEALIEALRQKLVEESFEALDAKSGHDLISELADVSEVIDALCSALRYSPSHLRSTQKKKASETWGIEKGVMLTRTATPHSIHQPRPELLKPLLTFQANVPETQVIGRPSDLPTKPLYRRPDLRHVNRQPEKLFTFATEVNKLGDLSATLNFSLPIDTGVEQQFALTLELHRSGGDLRGQIRVRLLPSQAQFNFSEYPAKRQNDISDK